MATTTQAGTGPDAGEAMPRPPRARKARAAVTVIVLVLVAVAGYLGSYRDTAPAPTSTTDAVALPVPLPAATVAQLVAMADGITNASTDSHHGSVTYVETEQWARRDGSEIVGFHHRRWREVDGSGRAIVRRVPAQPARGFNLHQIGRTDFGAAEAQIITYRAGQLTPYLHAEASDGPAVLATQLGVGAAAPPGMAPCPPPCQPRPTTLVALDTVVGLHQDDYLNRDQRAALLRVIAVLPGLTYGGPATDRAGRPGIAVWAEEGGVRITLIVNRTTGELLASERSIPDFVLDNYILFLRHDRRDHIG